MTHRRHWRRIFGAG